MTDPSDPLVKFGTASDAGVRSAAIRQLIKSRTLISSKEHPDFLAGLDLLFGDLGKNDKPDLRLPAAANIGRIWSVIQSIRPDLSRRIGKQSITELPELSDLESVDDRFYVALFLKCVDDDWVSAYQARAAVLEDAGEKVRSALVAGLLERSPTITHALQVTTEAVSLYKPTTQNPGVSRGKKLVRLCRAFRAALLETELPAGEEVGKRLASFFNDTFGAERRPESTNVAVETAEECAQLVHTLVRSRLTLVAETDVYAAMKIPRRWLSRVDWRAFARKSNGIKSLAEDIEDALVLLARQGIADGSLAKELSEILGSRDDATSRMAHISETHPELSPDVREWFRNGGKVVEQHKLEYAEESQQLAADQHIALLYIESSLLRELVSGIAEDVVSELHILDPKNAKFVEQVVKGSAHILERIVSLAQARRMQLVENRGEMADFDQARHEVVGGNVLGIRKVRIVRPSVDRIGTSGRVETVMKALVEKVD